MTELERERVRRRLRNTLFGATQPPIRVGRYEIVEYLGRGGMSVVYSALDPRLGRKIALKVVGSANTNDIQLQSLQQRLLQEGEALASLSHPNVVAVYDMGESDDHAYLALELIDGETLKDWASRIQPSWRDVLTVVLPAADGLAAAHATGLVHRDVTPQNIVIDNYGSARVIDFGLVRAGRESSHSAPEIRGPLHLTQTGAALGTPLYMAPEQWECGIIDDRTDQFGFCATLFEALYGTPPFPNTDIDTLRTAVTEGRIYCPSTSEVPAWLDCIVRIGLHPSPQSRHKSLATMVLQIREHIASLDQLLGAQASIQRLQLLLSDESANVADIDRVAVEIRSTCDAVVLEWPENNEALASREEFLTLLIHYELRRENADVASRLLSDMHSPDNKLKRLVSESLERNTTIAARLEKLEEIEFNTDKNVANLWKVFLQSLGVIASGVIFLVFGYLNRHNVYDIGTTEVGVFYLAFGALHGLSYFGLADVYNTNSVTRHSYNFGAVSLAAHAGMMFACHWMQIEISLAFILAHWMAIAVWLVVGVTTDLRHALAVPGILVSMIGTIVWPSACFEFAAFAYFGGVGAVGIALALNIRASPTT